VAVNTSLPEVDRAHPILDAIAGFRDAVNRLIDEHKAGLLHKGAESESDRPVDAGPRLPGVESAGAPRYEMPSAGRTWVAPQSVSRAGSESPLPSRPQGLISEAVGPTTSEPSSTPHQDDPRQRLDALAKLLDRRRKPAGSAMTDAPVCAVEDKDS
jgi:hypothetical protein